MDENPGRQSDGDVPSADSTQIDLSGASSPFVGDWNRLVSRTNWEKGRIIFRWRQALMDSGARPIEYSDEAWSRLVGGVSGQHVGRLRRVFQRFGETFDQYDGLFWSHFHAAIEWHDAEMWLEGAVQSDWSVSQLKQQRFETLGEVHASDENEAEEPQDLDEDYVEDAFEEQIPDTISGVVQQVDSDDEPVESTQPSQGSSHCDDATDAGSSSNGGEISAEDDGDTIQFVRPFENLSQLPDDLADAFEEFKLVILRHKSEDWQQISRDDLLAALEALKALVLAPSNDSPPF